MKSPSDGRRIGPPNASPNWPPAAAGWQKLVQPSDSHRQYSHRTQISTECTAPSTAGTFDKSGAPPIVRRARALVEALATWIRNHTSPHHYHWIILIATGIVLLRGMAMMMIATGMVLPLKWCCSVDARLPSGSGRCAQSEQNRRRGGGSASCPVILHSPL